MSMRFKIIFKITTKKDNSYIFNFNACCGYQDLYIMYGVLGGCHINCFCVISVMKQLTKLRLSLAH